MHGYSNLAGSSPPMASNGAVVRARRSMELTNTKETNAWEGLAIGAVTLARTFSTGSHRISSSSAAATARSCGERTTRGGGGMPGAVRRAFSMRRHPAGYGKGDGYYWRIHDMDGGSDGGGDDDNAAAAGEEHDDEEEKNNKKKEQLDEAADGRKEAAGKVSTATATTTTTKKKRGGNILRACKKLFWL
ncbi:hypothetical protein GUJ93_ZPchr0010g9953 [Zizania palustris]|uniref:Uncharacterized protein n=1 Tax=Zizania palustris TaxID=103762 RepID=A0A8J5WCE5_ZIZPA|nr:hypothetical protein GUJ93_ZPchr0010g9953 [Zizania palustris]